MCVMNLLLSCSKISGFFTDFHVFTRQYSDSLICSSTKFWFSCARGSLARVGSGPETLSAAAGVAIVND